MKHTIARSSIVLTVAAIAFPAVAEAKTRSVDMRAYDGKQSGTTITGKFKGTPFGQCTMKGKLEIPKTRQTLKCKGGTVKLVGTASSGASNSVKGTWKITGGSGKFAGARGKGSFTGTLSTAKYHYKGKVSY